MKYVIVFMVVFALSFPREVEAVSYYADERNPITLEVMRPSDVKFPVASGAGLLVINHAPHQPKGQGHLFDDSRREGFVNFEVDTLSGLFTDGLAGFMRRSGNFGKVRSIALTDVPADSPFQPTRMTTDDASLLASMWKVDLVMVVEWVFVESKLSADYSYEHNAFRGSYDMKVTSQVSLYTNRGKTLYHTYRNIDSTFVQELGEGIDEALSYLPPAAEVFADATLSGVEGMGARFFPTAQHEERYLFQCARDKLSKEAVESVEQHDWEHARLIWETQIANSKLEKVLVYAHFNMALYWELKEEWDKALGYMEQIRESYAVKAKPRPDRMPLSYINEYTTLLKRRKMESTVLDRQFE